MILQALYNLAESENLMSDADFQWKPVAWLVRIGPQGRFVGISGTHYTPAPEDGRELGPQAKCMRVPRQADRSGNKAPPYFLVDNAKYVFGKPTADKSFPEKTGRARATDFREVVRQCHEATSDEAARAVLAFLDDIASGKQDIELPEDCKSNDQFAFVYAPDGDVAVHERPAIEEYWHGQRAESDGDEKARFVCMVTGRPVEAPSSFPKVKKVPGATGSGGSLVSFNKPAFLSYGLKTNQNAPISRFAAEACSAALSRLLDTDFCDPNRPGEKMPRRNYSLGGDTVACFWSSSKEADAFLDVFPDIMEARPEEVGATYHSIWRGKSPDGIDPAEFYVLTLSGAQGRAVLRDWFESSLRDVVQRIARYFDDIDIVRNTRPPRNRPLPPQLPLTVLLRSLAPKGKSGQVPPSLGSDMFRAAVTGTRYPLTVLHRALERMRAEIGDDSWAGIERRDARAALIKAVLIRNMQKEITSTMDPNNKEPGYLLGRLLAVIERTQQAAMGDVNASVIDRYFSGASATPAAVFPRLLKNMRHHVRKGRDSEREGRRVRWLDSEADGILAAIEPGPSGAFPVFLPIDQQGLFVLGYHHQRHALWSPKKDTATESTETPAQA